MIIRNKFVVIVKSDNAETFAEELASVYLPGEVEPMSGQWLFFNNQGIHTAYLCDKPKLPKDEEQVVPAAEPVDSEDKVSGLKARPYVGDVSHAQACEGMYS